MSSRLFSHRLLRRHAGLLNVIWIAYWIILFGLTHSPKLPRIPVRLDRRLLIAHVIAFAILAILCVIARRAKTPIITWGWRIKWIWFFAVYAAMDEILQPLSGRHADYLDWVADMFGVVVVMLLVRRDG